MKIEFRNWKFLLLLLPLGYLIITGVFLVNWTPFYLHGPDPIYAYLLNGATLASGKLQIGHTDHPGTPVQCFVAVVIFIKHLFSHNTLLYQDVLMNPESYLHVICTVISLLYVLITWYTGYYLFKRTGNIITALLFQLTPLISLGALYGQNPQPESFILIIGILFMAYIYYHSVFNDLHSKQKIAIRQIIIYGIFSGFLVACKYTCLPLLFIVLFLLPTIRSRIFFIGSFIFFFFLFISPVYPMWARMFHWVTDLATHTGMYGTGDKGIIKPAEFFGNLKNVFKEDFYFTSIYVLISIALLIALAKRKQTQPENKIHLNLLCGVWLSSTFLILLVAKHYSFHYLLPVIVCFPLAITGIYKIFRNIPKIKILQNRALCGTLFYIVFTFLILFNVIRSFRLIYRPVPYETTNFLEKFPAEEPIIISADYQCARIEPSLDFGAAFTGTMRMKYSEFLNKLYPNSYLYQQFQGTIKHWNDIAYTPELFAKHSKILVYFYDNDPIERDSILANFCNWNHTIKLADAKLIYVYKKMNEYVYELTDFQNNSKALLNNYTETDFDFEKLTPDKSKFVSVDGSHTYRGTNYLNNKVYRSGNNSILLNSKTPYSFTYPIRTEPGNLIIITIWEKQEENNTAIVLSSQQNRSFYNSGLAVIDSDAKGWQQIEYKCRVPSSVKDTVSFYLYYYGHDSAYFDDLSVKVYPMRFNNSTFAKKDSI